MNNWRFWGAVAVLGVMQIFAWGSTYYAPAVFLPHIIQETGWPPSFIWGSVSLALLAGGLCTPLAAKGINAGRGAWCLGGGSLLFALGLACLGHAYSLTAYAAAWAIMGMGMGLGLYDAAFSIVSVGCGQDSQQARRAITAITLVGGFASTLAWPVLSDMVQEWGWRETCSILAALHATVGISVNVLLAGWCFAPSARISQKISPAGGVKRTPHPEPAGYFAVLVGGFTLLAFISVAFSSNIIALLQGIGAESAVAMGTVLWFGPAQVGARLVEMFLGRHWHPRWTAISGGILVTLGITGLYFSGGESILLTSAIVAYGAGNGLLTIARGTLPLALYPSQFVRRLGMQARCILFGQALAPLAMGLLWEYTAPQGLLLLLVFLALVALGCLTSCFFSMPKEIRHEERKAYSG